MIPDPPGGVGRDREPAGRATTTAPTGSAGEADGGRPRARRGGGGDRDPVEKSRAARVLGNAAGRGGREGERRRPRGRSSPSRDVRGGAPRTHDAREGRTSGTGRVIDRSPRRRQPEESGRATRWGISPPGAQPGADGGSPHVRRERPSRRTDDGAGRVPRRTSADGPTVNSRRPRTTPAKPLSLARFPETRGGLLFFPHSHRPHTFETDAPAAADGPPAATGPDASGDAPETTDRRFSKGRARERGHGPATPEPDPRPRGGTGHRCSPIVGTLPGRGGARRLHTARRNERHTRTRRARRGRGRGNGKDGEAREGPLAAGTDGADGWDPGAHRHPAPLFPLGSAPRGVRTIPLGGAG